MCGGKGNREKICDHLPGKGEDGKVKERKR